MHAPPTLSRISSRREFASSPQSTPRAKLLPSHDGAPDAAAHCLLHVQQQQQHEQPDDDAGKRKGLSSRTLTLAQLLHSLLPFLAAATPSAGLPRVASLGSFGVGAPAPSALLSAHAASCSSEGGCSSDCSGGSCGSGGSSAASGAGSGGAGGTTSSAGTSTTSAAAAASTAAAYLRGPCSLQGLLASSQPRAAWVCTRLPFALALLIFLVTLASWEVAPARHTLDPALPAHIPALVIPTSPGRGPSLLATLHSLESRVEVLLLCNSAPQVPELQCVLEEVTLLAAQGELNIGRVRIVTPGPRAPGPVYGVAECWNALVDAAFGDEALAAPWVLVMNDDVGLPAGALGAAVEETWRTHQRHSLLLAHEGLPGTGYAFSAFVLTRAGRAALGSFDENFYPAYYEDCDYFRRAQLLGMPWRRLPQLHILHPIQKYLPRLPALGARVGACMASTPPSDAARAVAVQGAVGAMLTRARSPSAWRDFAHSDRYYYAKKWGGALNKCGEGAFPTPFNNPQHPLAFWEPDAAMRRATLAGTALEAAAQ